MEYQGPRLAGNVFPLGTHVYREPHPNQGRLHEGPLVEVEQDGDEQL